MASCWISLFVILSLDFGGLHCLEIGVGLLCVLGKVHLTLVVRVQVVARDVLMVAQWLIVRNHSAL